MNSDTIQGGGFPLAFKAGVGKRPAVVRGDTVARDVYRVETTYCPLADQLTGPVRLQTRNIVWAFAAAGPQTVDLSACPRMPP
jgi:hypothetical protein